MTMSSESPHILSLSGLQRLLDVLDAKGYRIVGPAVRDGAMVWDTVRRISDLPVGWQDQQEPGRYRLEQTGSSVVFGITHGPHSLKPFAFVPREPLLQIERASGGFVVHPKLPQTEKIAVIGARSCDLAGLAIQDQIFLNGTYPDNYYAIRREGFLVIAVNCTRALPTCFCASTETGPRARRNFDLALTEVDEMFLVEAGSPAGRDVLMDIVVAAASATLIAEASTRVEACARSQVRRLGSSGMPQALYEAYDHPHWDEVAARCLACANCTMVCPTCFCHTVEETPDLARENTEHTRLWDSCFTQEHGYIHGKNIRPAIKDRYRMWLTHKLASWVDQFGTSGCVGCGRCITWCPVGIDLTEELQALRKAPTPANGSQEQT